MLTSAVPSYQAPAATMLPLEVNGQEQITMAPKKPHIGVKEEASDYLVYNQNILNGYRINYNTWGATFCSLFQLHNETVNVWTHLLGFLVCFVAFLVINYSATFDPSSL